MNEKIIPLLKELIQNRCVNRGTQDSGEEIKSALTLKSFFDSCRIKSEIFESIPGRASILARVKGKSDSAPSLMYMGHLDVVPASDDGWSSDPFSGDERGGYIWGRGTVDMLGMTACAACAFSELASGDKKSGGDLIFLAVADEESSGRLGARWLCENHWDKVKCDYMISEGGGYFLTSKPRRTIAVTRGEKGIGWARLSARGVSGHGSLPYMSENAAIEIALAVIDITRKRSKVTITKEYSDIIKMLPLGMPASLLLRIPFSVDLALGSLGGRYPGLVRHLHALSRMTLSANVVNAGHKINTIPDKGIIECDIRLLPGETIEDVYAFLRKALGSRVLKYGIEIIDYFPSNISQVYTPLYEAVSEMASTVYPDADCVPNMFSGVTDARFWRMRGTTAYGFALFDESMTLDEYARVLHGNDERISLKSLELMYNFYLKLPDALYAKAAAWDSRKTAYRHSS